MSIIPLMNMLKLALGNFELHVNYIAKYYTVPIVL